jgi:hypothetical protein
MYYVEVTHADFIMVERATRDPNTFTPPILDCPGIGQDHCSTTDNGDFEWECRPDGAPNCTLYEDENGFGSLHEDTDVDSWSVIFEHGATYIITVKGAGDQSGDNDNGGTLADPKLEILELADYDNDENEFTWSVVATSTHKATDNRNIEYEYVVTDFEVQAPWLLRVSSGDTPTGAGTYLISLRKK